MAKIGVPSTRLSKERLMARCFISAALFTLIGVTPTFAQQGTGDVAGRVLDTQGGLLPGVTIVVRHQDSGLFRQTVITAQEFIDTPSFNRNFAGYLGMMPGVVATSISVGAETPAGVRRDSNFAGVTLPSSEPSLLGPRRTRGNADGEDRTA